MYELIIGLEIHVQPKTKSKMFCSCDANYFGDAPNTHVCPVCLGLPGALPVPNKEAIRKCVKVALALNCNINKESRFDRKNYFYPDLPKGYQITQSDFPFGYEGWVELDVNGEKKKFRITRVHMEEDTGKSVHKGEYTMLDFNKSGLPLIEIVTEPDFHSVEEVSLFATRLRQIIRYIGVSDADMEKGQMRFELNISLRKEGSNHLPKYKVEVKNIASISVLEKVIKFEYERQKAILESGSVPLQETRGLLDMSGKTKSQRVKENANDYRYFPEPDIPPIELSDEYIEEVKKEIPELPEEKKSRYISDYELSSEIAENIVSSVRKVEDFEYLINEVNDNKLIREIAKWYIGDYWALLNEEEPNEDFKLEFVKEVAKLVATGKINKTTGQAVLKKSFETGKRPADIVSEENLEIVTDDNLLLEIVQRVITENPKVLEDYKKNPNAAMFLIGLVMREMHGKADARVVKDLVFEEIEKRIS